MACRASYCRQSSQIERAAVSVVAVMSPSVRPKIQRTKVLPECAVGLLTYGSVTTLSLPGHPVASTSMISPLTVAGAVTASAPKLDILTVFPVRLLAEGLRSTTQLISDMPSAERQHPGIHSYCKIASFGVY